MDQFALPMKGGRKRGTSIYPGQLFYVGYQNWSPEALVAAIGKGQVLFDTRMSPRSRRPEWNRSRLKATCDEAGVIYTHSKGFGNKLFKQGGIEPLDPEPWIELALVYLKADVDVTLMCQCPVYHSCHRSHVAREFKPHGVIALPLPKPLGIGAVR